MQNFPWQKIILSILILAIMIGVSGCQSKPFKGTEDFINSFARAPDILGRIVTDLLGGLRNIGGALADQISNIVGGMIER
jgi:hypothetical protein